MSQLHWEYFTINLQFIPSTSKQNIGNRTPLSDGPKKEIYWDVQFFHGALQLNFNSSLWYPFEIGDYHRDPDPDKLLQQSLNYTYQYCKRKSFKLQLQLNTTEPNKTRHRPPALVQPVGWLVFNGTFSTNGLYHAIGVWYEIYGAGKQNKNTIKQWNNTINRKL